MFKGIVENPGATSLLASHGYDIYGSPQAKIFNLRAAHLRGEGVSVRSFEEQGS